MEFLKSILCEAFSARFVSGVRLLHWLAEGEQAGCDRSRGGLPGEHQTGRTATPQPLSLLWARQVGQRCRELGPQPDFPERRSVASCRLRQHSVEFLLGTLSRRSSTNTASRRWAAVNSDRLPMENSFPVKTSLLYPKEASLSTFPINPELYTGSHVARPKRPAKWADQRPARNGGRRYAACTARRREGKLITRPPTTEE